MISGGEARHHRYHFVGHPRFWVKLNGHGKLIGCKLGLLKSGPCPRFLGYIRFSGFSHLFPRKSKLSLSNLVRNAGNLFNDERSMENEARVVVTVGGKRHNHHHAG